MGRRISRQRKNDLVRWFKVLSYAAFQVYEQLPLDDKISLSHLNRLRTFILRNDKTENMRWIDSNYSSTGRRHIIDVGGKKWIKNRIDRENTNTQKLLHKQIHEYDRLINPSLTTVHRTFSRIGYSRKVLERRHIRIDHVARVEYYEDISWVDPFKFVDIDEMSSSPKEFFQKYGYAPIGEPAIKYQIVLNGKTYCVICAYTPLGFIAWEIYENETVNAEKFRSFLRNRLRPMLIEGSFPIIDNWSGHKTDESLNEIEDVFDGLYRFSVPYCPFDKPVEKGIYLVKTYIRDHEEEAVTNPIQFINNTFQLFQVGGPKSHICLGHWSGYFENHKNYLNQF